MMKNKSCPQVVPSLEGLFIEDIAVGCEHVLALSSTGDVYAWGCNSEGQVTNTIRNECIHFDLIAHHKLSKDCTVVCYICLPAWSWTLQPSERAHTHHSSAGEEHQTGLCWPLPQLSMDHPLYLNEKLRYTDLHYR